MVVTCEHGGHRVPGEFQPIFDGADELLRSHRGWDPGALGLARTLARRLDAPLHAATVSRLVVDLNRSSGHPRVLSERTRALPEAERRKLLGRLHAPWREAVRAEVERARARGRPVLHLSVHSFTPVLEGRERRTELALLYDPARSAERSLAAAWTRALRARCPGRSIRRNHPYRGVSDGMTRWLRDRFPEPEYLGMEIEVGQALVEGDRFPAWVAEALVEGLGEAWAAGTGPEPAA